MRRSGPSRTSDGCPHHIDRWRKASSRSAVIVFLTADKLEFFGTQNGEVLGILVPDIIDQDFGALRFRRQQAALPRRRCHRFL
jgi:hypothetical protein